MTLTPVLDPFAHLAEGLGDQIGRQHGTDSRDEQTCQVEYGQPSGLERLQALGAGAGIDLGGRHREKLRVVANTLQLLGGQCLKQRIMNDLAGRCYIALHISQALTQCRQIVRAIRQCYALIEPSLITWIAQQITEGQTGFAPGVIRTQGLRMIARQKEDHTLHFGSRKTASYRNDLLQLKCQGTFHTMAQCLQSTGMNPVTLRVGRGLISDYPTQHVQVISLQLLFQRRYFSGQCQLQALVLGKRGRAISVEYAVQVLLVLLAHIQLTTESDELGTVCRQHLLRMLRRHISRIDQAGLFEKWLGVLEVLQELLQSRHTDKIATVFRGPCCIDAQFTALFPPLCLIKLDRQGKGRKQLGLQQRCGEAVQRLQLGKYFLHFLLALHMLLEAGAQSLELFMTGVFQPGRQCLCDERIGGFFERDIFS
ncbi:hypothetical protein D3C78_918230 [compost metagenome]